MDRHEAKKHIHNTVYVHPADTYFVACSSLDVDEHDQLLHDHKAFFDSSKFSMWIKTTSIVGVYVFISRHE